MSVTTPQGFRAAGATAGLKPSGNPDVALVVNDGPAHAAAGVFTRNKVQAAPVLWSRQVLTAGRLRAVVLNSGGANACTGPQGFQTAHATAEKAAELLGCGPVEVAVCSTGIIGEQLPRDVLLAGVEAAAKALGDDAASGRAAATAIMTTDTVAKEAAHADPAGWSIGGTTKGAGMIAPSMATMLTVLTTDAVVDAPVLDEALRAAVRLTFDRLDVDGSMSTNDTVLRPGLGGLGRARRPGRLHHRAHRGLRATSRARCRPTPRASPSASPCASPAPRPRTRPSSSPAPSLATAWSRPRCSAPTRTGAGSRAAAGYADAALDPERLDVTINGVLLCRGGVAAGDRPPSTCPVRTSSSRSALGLGDGAAEILTTDLSHGYVEENSAYST